MDTDPIGFDREDYLAIAKVAVEEQVVFDFLAGVVVYHLRDQVGAICARPSGAGIVVNHENGRLALEHAEFEVEPLYGFL